MVGIAGAVIGAKNIKQPLHRAATQMSMQSSGGLNSFGGVANLPNLQQNPGHTWISEASQSPRNGPQGRDQQLSGTFDRLKIAQGLTRGASFFSSHSPDGRSNRGEDESDSEESIVKRSSTMILREEIQPKVDDADPFSGLRVSVFHLLHSPKFDACIGIVIMVNSITVGIEQTYRLRNQPTDLLDLLEKFFLSIYIIEMSMRFFASGWRCLRDPWVQFDFVLVIIGCLSVSADIFLKGESELGPLMVLRTGRLLRLARTVRLLVKFRVLWMLVRGLLNSTGTMLYTMLLLLIIIYIFSCISMEIITTHSSRTDEHPQFKATVDMYFNSLPVTMLTLIQFVCLDSVGGIYKPLVEEDGKLVLYFVSIILIVPIVLMNLVTAVIVNGALEQALQDKEAAAVHEAQEKKKLVKDLRKIFERADEDGSGEVSRIEIQNMPEQDKRMLLQISNFSDPLEIFDTLDIDDSGHLDIDEFCDGLWQVVISKVSPEIRRMEKQTNEIFIQLRGVGEELNFLRQRLCPDDYESWRKRGGGSGIASPRPVERPPSPRNSPSSPRRRKRNLTNLRPSRDFSYDAAEGMSEVGKQDGDVTYNNNFEPDAEPIPGDTPAWAKLMILELRGLRKHWQEHQAVGSPSGDWMEGLAGSRPRYLPRRRISDPRQPGEQYGSEASGDIRAVAGVTYLDLYKQLHTANRALGTLVESLRAPEVPPPLFEESTLASSEGETAAPLQRHIEMRHIARTRPTPLCANGPSFSSSKTSQQSRHHSSWDESETQHKSGPQCV